MSFCIKDKDPKVHAPLSKMHNIRNYVKNQFHCDKIEYVYNNHCDTLDEVSGTSGVEGSHYRVN